jgi:hypothetical protein
MASMSPPTEASGKPGVGGDDQRFLRRSLFVSRYWSNSSAVSSISLCRDSAARYEQAISPIRWIRRKSPYLGRSLGSGVSQQKATVLAGESERSFQRILDARENRCHHRTTGLMLSEMQAGATSAQCVDRAVEQGSGRPKRVGCTERPRSHVFSAELFAGVPCGISRRLPR